jgi:Transposase DDE domain.
MLTAHQYIEYLIATVNNYTCSNLAEHLTGDEAMSHDAVTDFLHRGKLTPRLVWDAAQPSLINSPESYLILDDSVHEKAFAQKIDLVKLQYSGAKHGLTKGIGVLSLIHSTGEPNAFTPVDFRIHHPETDGKTRHEHFREMLSHAVSDKGLKARIILFDSWYASVDNLKFIHRLGRCFVTTLKSNRMVSLSKEGGYIHLDQLEWTCEQLEHGITLKLKELPFKVQLFKVVASNGDIDWVITNLPLDDPQCPITTEIVAKHQDVRWQVEQLHRELKQLTGTAKCQCRKARAQRNHLTCCYLAFIAIHRKAVEWMTTDYEAVKRLLRNYLINQLKQPTITAVGV